LLAGDGYTHRKWPHLKVNGTLEQWWEFALDDKNTNNYALRVLAGNGCCQGNATSREHLETAKSILRRLTFVLDVECLDEGTDAVLELLGISDLIRKERGSDINNSGNNNLRRRLQQQRQRLLKPRSHQHPPPEERIPFREVYEYLRDKNRLDIELYEWSKTRSLVNCTAIREAREKAAAVEGVDGDGD